MNDQKNQGENPPDNPTLGRNAGYHVDEQGNITGIFFPMDVDNFVEFTDQAVIYPLQPKNPDKPQA